MLDNGYVYLAATRLSLFHSTEDWALVIEVFGYSPRAGMPDTNVAVRGREIPIPARDEYARHGIELVDPTRARVFELCRFLAANHRNEVLATPAERRISVRPELTHLLQLEEWCHPNVVDESERPSGSPVFQQLARVLETGDVNAYRPSPSSNTHWSNWPDGGTL